MLTDRELLSRYAVHQDEGAFGELVARHLNLVYSAALRQTVNPPAAQDVAQLVFSDLARKAGGLPETVTLAAWLHRATRFAAAQHRRTERRRTRRELEVHAMQQHDHGQTEPVWEEVRGLLDESLDELPAGDREALLLRYFGQQDFSTVGTALGATGEAARKRVDRALDRLRKALARRGITTTAAALSGALTVHAVQFAPAGLATTLTTGSLAAAATTTGWLVHLPLLASMNTKTALAGVAALAVLLAPIAPQEKSLAKARDEQRELTGNFQVPAPVTSSSVGTGSTSVDRAEIVRLHRLAADLSARLEGLNRRLAVAEPPPENLPPALAMIEFSKLRDAGQATPTAVLETHFWALLHGDTNRIIELSAPDPSTDPQLFGDRLAELKTNAAKGVEARLAQMSLQQVRVLGEGPADLPTDHWLFCEFVEKPDSPRSRQKIRMLMRLTPSGWRIVLGVDTEPVVEVVLQP